MDLRLLRTFALAAETQSFTRAAERLGITQAAVSQQVASLEKELGVCLFDRTSRSVVPTAAGRKLYEYAQRILTLVEEAELELRRERTAVQSTVTIAVSTVPAEIILPELLERFHQQCPEVREVVHVLDSQAAIDAVENNKADLGIVGELPRSDRLTARALAADELVLVVSPAHPWANAAALSPRSLLTERLIMREPGSGTRRCLEQALADVGLPPNSITNTIEMNSNEAIRSAVERGVGAAFLSRRIVSEQLAAGRLVSVPVAGLRPQRHFYAITNSRSVLKAPARCMLQLLNQLSPTDTTPAGRA